MYRHCDQKIVFIDVHIKYLIRNQEIVCVFVCSIVAATRGRESTEIGKLYTAKETGARKAKEIERKQNAVISNVSYQEIQKSICKSPYIYVWIMQAKRFFVVFLYTWSYCAEWFTCTLHYCASIFHINNEWTFSRSHSGIDIIYLVDSAHVFVHILSMHALSARRRKKMCTIQNEWQTPPYRHTPFQMIGFECIWFKMGTVDYIDRIKCIKCIRNMELNQITSNSQNW